MGKPPTFKERKGRGGGRGGGLLLRKRKGGERGRKVRGGNSPNVRVSRINTGYDVLLNLFGLKK